MLSGAVEKARANGDAWAMHSTRVVTPAGPREAFVVVRGERIEAVADDHPGCPVESVGERAILPGVVDAHVHINEPGRTEWEGFRTATRAAAAGGVTTVVDMPLNSSPVTTRRAALGEKLAAAEGKLWVDCGFYGGIVPGNAAEMDGLIAGGVLGFKAFLCHSGIDDFPASDRDDLAACLPALARAGVPLLAHAERISPLPAEVARRFEEAPTSYRAYLATRPARWECDAIAMLIDLCRQDSVRTHIVHLATSEALPAIAAAKEAGLPLTVETCPHYLTFAAEEIPDGDTRFKCAPPIRAGEERERLWSALRSGLVDTIGSDHSPAPPELKRLDSGNLREAWGGIASLQLTLPAVWTGTRMRGGSLADVARWLSENPARLVGLADRKGALVAGRDADLVVFDPEAEWTVDAAKLHHRHRTTPYDGRRVTGRIDMTLVRGQPVFLDGEPVERPMGRTIRKGEG